MAVPRNEHQERLLTKVGTSRGQLLNLVPAGHKIGEVAPIFRNITDEEVSAFRAKYAGGKK